MKKLLFIILLLPVLVNAQVIVTVAGTGEYGYAGDGGAATNAKLRHPEGVELDDAGNLYICDNSCVRKVSPTGFITTVAGSSSGGFSGDGGPAIYALVSGVHDVAVDHLGNLYLADAGNNRVRKVTPDGMINTIAGTGVQGYNGDGIPAITAQLNSPVGIAVDDTGNIYIADSYNYRIRKINTAGIISTIAGTGVSGYGNDVGLATTVSIRRSLSPIVDKSGNVYFCDSTRIRKINTAGIISTVAGVATFGFSGDGGPAIAAEIMSEAIAIDTFGNLLLADGGNNRIRMVSGEGTITTIAGTGSPFYNGDGIPPLMAAIGSPSGIFVDRIGDIYMGDVYNNRIRMITNRPIGVRNVVPQECEGVVAYPNPACNEVTVRVSEEVTNVSVVNTAGQLFELPPAMPAVNNKRSAVVLDISTLPVGAYLVRVNGRYITTFVKE